MLSPGPCTPNEAGICLELIEKAGPTIPLLGVCLGHQAIGQVYGGKVIRAPQPMHGKLSTIAHTRQGPVRRPAEALRGDALSLADRRARDACPTASRSRPRPPTASSWACSTRRIPCTACSSIPRASPPSTATSCSPTSCELAGLTPQPPQRRARATPPEPHRSRIAMTMPAQTLQAPDPEGLGRRHARPRTRSAPRSRS